MRMVPKRAMPLDQVLDDSPTLKPTCIASNHRIQMDQYISIPF
jgi:hypothetical protein